MKPLILGTRGSPLALNQTRQVMADLKKAWPGRNFEIHVIKTEGDKLAESDAGFDGKLGKGLFTTELEQQLLSGQIDLAVHSLKDLPVSQPTGLMIAVYLSDYATSKVRSVFKPLVEILAGMEARPGEPELKRTPAPYAANHPRAELLRRKGLNVWQDLDVGLTGSPELVDAVVTAFQAMDPVNVWLTEALEEG